MEEPARRVGGGGRLPYQLGNWYSLPPKEAKYDNGIPCRQHEIESSKAIPLLRGTLYETSDH